MAERPVLSAIEERGVAPLTLNRPEVHNAYNGAMIEALIAADARVRPLVLRAHGKQFQAALKRASAEAAEGLASFRDRRDPAWYAPP